MKKSLLICLSFFTLKSQAQIISQFTWDSNPVTMASVGPNAISVSSSANSSPNGVGGTNGLNAGLPKKDVNLVIADDPIFDVPGIDISFDYQREESQGAFFTRGNSLVIDGCANLSVRYRVDNGVGSFFTVSSGNVYAIPNDNTFRTYRFIYLPASGTGTLMVDGVTVWSNDGADGRDLYWVGAGDIIIGSLMDGSGNNRTFLDNLTIGAVTSSPLPVSLNNFEAKEVENKFVDLTWETSSEINNDFFTIQKSIDGQEWQDVTNVLGAGNSNTTKLYNVADNNPFIGESFYRLKQTDFNGDFTYSKIRTVNINSSENDISIYPNPTNGIINIITHEDFTGEIIIYNGVGQIIRRINKTLDSQSNNQSIDLSNVPNGVYFLQSNKVAKKIIKN